MHKTIFLNISYQVAGKVITSLLGIIVVIYLTRYLGANKFGEYSLALGFPGFFSIFADLGLTTLLTRDYAREKNEQLFHTIFFLRGIVSFLIVVVTSLVALFFPYSQEVKLAIMLSSLGTFFLSLSSITWAVFQAKLLFKNIVIAQIGSSLVNIILIFLTIQIRLGLLYLILTSVVSSLVGLIISFLILEKEKVQFDKTKLKYIITQGLPIGLGVIVSVGYFKIDSLILSWFFNPTSRPDVGIYSLAYKIFEVSIVFGGFFTQTLFPFFSKNIKEKSFLKNYNHYLKICILLSITTAVSLYVLAKPLVLLLGSNIFSAATYSVQILSIASFASILSGFFINIGIASHKQKTLLYYGVIAFIVNSVLNVIFLPKYSFTGASWTTVITQLFILLTNYLVAKNVVKEAQI